MSKISKFFRGLFRKQITYTVLALVLTIGTLTFIVYTSTFLITHLNQSLTFDETVAPTIQFDIEGYEKLNLAK